MKEVRPEIEVLSLTPVSLPELVLSVWQDGDGWMCAWAEPVTILAVVRVHYYDNAQTIAWFDMSREERRKHSTGTETRIEPVVYDVNTIGGYSSLSQLDEVPWADYPEVVPADISWEDLIHSVQGAQQQIDRKKIK